jgi:sulfur-carrier protein
MKTVTVRYFAALREALGQSEELLFIEGWTVGVVRDALIASSQTHAQMLARSRPVLMALNHEMCDEARFVQPGAELAFFPPVTGG